MVYKKKFFYYIVGIFIFLAGTILIIHDIFFTDSFGVLSYYHESVQNKEKDDIIFRFHITAQENNLGILSVKLISKKHIVNKKVTFIIKDQNGHIISTSNYNSDYFDSVGYFPFGFPTISNSQNKTYEALLIASDKRLINDLVLEEKEPIISKYVSNSEQLTSNPEFFTTFLLKKIYYYFIFIPNVIKSLFFFTPFFIYIFIVTRNYLYLEKFILQILNTFLQKDRKKVLNYYDSYIHNRTYYLIIISVPFWILFHAIMLPVYNELLYSIMVVYLLYVIYRYKISLPIFIFYEIILLAFTILLLAFKLQSHAEIFVVWIYTLFWFIAFSLIHTYTHKKIL